MFELKCFLGQGGPSLVVQWLDSDFQWTEHKFSFWSMHETLVRSLGQEDPLEMEMATHSSTLA